MVEALGHRGPDDHGIEVLGNVVLGHTRLSILDLTSAGHQPMRRPGGDWWVTYNGEAFNHVRLRAELPPTQWTTATDTETLLHGLDSLDEAFVDRINGLFAFAAVDPARRRLLLVRDRFGVKPLYLARFDGAVWFASELSALLAAGMPRDVRPDVLAHAVDRGWANGEATPFAAARSVRPGTWIEVDLDTLAEQQQQWYDPAKAVDAERLVSLSTASDAEVERAVEAELRAAVRRRLLSDVPVGTLLSGGVDSSLITALTAEVLPEVQTFTATIVDQPQVDEARYGRQVAEHLGTVFHAVPLDAYAWRRDLVDVVRHVEAPLLHESSVPMAHIARLARDHGVKVLLSGEGADELFGGYDFLHLSEWADFAMSRSRPERTARQVVRRLRRLANRQPWPDLERGSGPSGEVRAFERGVVARAARAYAAAPRRDRALAAAMLTDLELYLPHLLNRQDKTTMRASVETRVPFLDPALVALALNLTVASRVLPERKAPLRALARRMLPPVVASRPKVGFGFDVRSYLAVQRPEFLARGVLREVLEVGRQDWTSVLPSLGGRSPLLLTTGEIWARLFLRGDASADVDAALWG